MAKEIEDPRDQLLADVSEQNATDKIEHGKLPENTLTVILKVKGKVYGQGAALGDNIKPDMPDEDLDSMLRAVNGLSQTVQRRLIDLANKSVTYPLIGEESEQIIIQSDDTPES